MEKKHKQKTANKPVNRPEVKKNPELKKNESYQNIPGWGIDADDKNDPTYPMKDYNGADHQRLNYPRPPQQEQHIEVLHSLERPGISSVFGTAAPPRGLSGALRRFAFTKSEGQATHWMTLLLADRVDAAEGILKDLAKGHIPNIPAEKGFEAQWKHNRPGAVKKIITTAVVTAVAVTWLLTRRNRD